MTNPKFHAIGQIEDLVSGLTPQNEPFLFYLPRLLRSEKFVGLDDFKALTFVKLAMSPDRPPLVRDALSILNKLVDQDGMLVRPEQIHFYNNRSFMWKELGNHTDALHVITHILNKTFFVLSLGK